MKYFKIIKGSIIIGVVTSNDFMRYISITDCFIRANEQTGEYVSYNGQFYRSTWMQPIIKQTDYIEVQLINITQEEYNIYKQAIDINEIIENEIYEPTETNEEIYINPIDIASIEFIRASKITEMSNTCHKIIEAGIDLELRNEMRHFSLTTQDQLNLMSLNAMTATQELIPYHADGEACIFYTAEEIQQIVAAATAYKIYHTTYYNALKNYINALETIEDIAAITYGIDIPEEYQTDVLKALLANENNN